MNCTKCDNVFKCNGEIHDNCHINDEGLVCPDCVEMGKCDCEYCEEEDDECCWTCGKPDPTHKEYRDALGKNEYTCDKCHRNEYPEQYGEEEEEESKYCEFCGCDNLMKPNFEHFVKGFGWCSFCCKKQFEKQTYYNEEEDMYYFNGDY